MSPLLARLDEEIASLQALIASWVADGRSPEASTPIRDAQSTLAIRLAAAIRYRLGLAEPRKTAVDQARSAVKTNSIDPLRSDAEVEERQTRVLALAERLRQLADPSDASIGLAAS